MSATGVKNVVVSGAARGAVPVERPITIYVNEQEIVTLQGTPQQLDELAVGFLFTEGIIAKREDVGEVSVDAKQGLVWVTSPSADVADIVYKKRYLTSGCGKGVTFSSLGHARGMKPLSNPFSVAASHIHEMTKQLAQGAELYKQSGGLHSSGLADESGLLVQREDVGRHNTVDKVIGRLILDGIKPSGCFLLTTGRISYDMVVKAAKVRLPLIVSRTAVTDLAMDLAKHLKICLVGYARAGKLSVYTEHYRVSGVEQEGLS
ncbi:MAG: formate dehydrogenase accessory sulfurtransferase FdhD [Actinobacteria bacterium]|jgi:FdhD protein|nr:MAG: formate dehydrogenase accessory sulfurtransferase FdhD [Actinomycetota bacterium]